MSPSRSHTAGMEQAVRDYEQAVAERRCNYCERPWSQQGPICPGVTVGDYTHYHSPEWWQQVYGVYPTYETRRV